MQGKKFECSFCGREFDKKKGLTNHIRWHDLPQYLKFQGGYRIKRRKQDNGLSLSNEERQVILGSLLGDASIAINKNGVNAYYRELHSKSQKGYLIWKSNYLEKFNFQIRERKIFDKRTNKNYEQVLIWTKAHPVLTEFYYLFYRERKEVSREILDQITELGLAVWYMDDGYYNYEGQRCCLSTDNFSYDSHTIIRDWFKEKWDLDSGIHKSGKGYNICFNKINADKFLRLIDPFCIDLFHYKLGHLKEENNEKIKLKNHLRNKNKRKYYSLNKEKVSKSMKRTYEKHKEKYLKKRREDYIKKRDEILRKKKEYYIRNRETIRKKQKEHYMLNKIIKEGE